MNPRRAAWAAAALLSALSLAAAADPSGGGTAAHAGPRERRVRLTFDTQVPDELLRLMDGRVIDDDSLDAWVDLPGNNELLRLGRIRGELTRAELRENLWHTILGHENRRGTGLGSLAFDPIGDLRTMLSALPAMRKTIERRVEEAVVPYMPPGVRTIDAEVRFHLGGTWSGRTSDAIYVNLSFFHDFKPPWLESIDSVIAHEVIHMIHRQVSSLPADAETAEGLFGVALGEIQAEGIARLVECQLLDSNYAPGTYGDFARRRYLEDLAGFQSAIARVEALRVTCLRSRDIAGCRRLIQDGLSRGGLTYSVGHGISKAIEASLGRATLAGTLAAGPERFFALYEQATRMHPGLPPLGEGFDADLDVAAGALAKDRRLWRLRDDAHRAHLAGEYDRAAQLLRQVMEISPGSAVDAYNLSCALARRGETHAALDWLERAVGLGYKDRRVIDSDPDLDPIRGSRRYRRLLGSLESPSDPPEKSSRK